MADDKSRLVLLASYEAKPSSQLEEEVVHENHSDGGDEQRLLSFLNNVAKQHRDHYDLYSKHHTHNIPV